MMGHKMLGCALLMTLGGEMNLITKKRASVLCLLGLLATQTSSSQGTTWEGLVRASTCGIQSADEPIIRGGDFSWNSTLADIQERAERLYQEGKRLRARAYINQEGDVVLPYESFNRPAGEVKITPQFVLSVRRHIEEALKLGYVDEVIFSDMGHSHFFIPQSFYDEVIAPIPASEGARRYELMLAQPELKMLYHTAEQLLMLDEERRLLDDRHLQWRFFTRNLVGDNKGQGKMELLHQEDHSHNTARGYLPGYRYWGAGYYLTANKDGCFAYRDGDEVKYFDLNLHGFEY